VLVKVQGSSINPVNIDLVEYPHATGLIGTDVSGEVVAVGSGSDCSHLTVGSFVWSFVNSGAYAEFVVADCKSTGLRPTSLSAIDAGTMPCVAVTSLECLKATGAPWSNRTNVTVAITSGQGGTGFIGIQLAKALTAAHIVTAASGDGIAFVKSLGADWVIDYTKQDLFDALPDNSVDIVYDNYGAKGTADKAMHAIRAGGVYLVMDTGGGGTISKHPKPGVTQIAFGMADFSDRTKGLDVLKPLFEAGKLQTRTQAAYNLTGVTTAFNVDTSGKVLGKLAIVP
jgi:NADPH:quinone reductase-like Zn-dependent oxidoreductase